MTPSQINRARHPYTQVGDFLRHCFQRDPTATMNFDGVWRHWVWFAQTYVGCKGLWPAPLPASKTALATVLAKHYNAPTKRVRKSYRRGEREPGQKPVLVTHLQGYRLNSEHLRWWPGSHSSWISQPWMDTPFTKFSGCNPDNLTQDPVAALVEQAREINRNADKAARNNPSLSPKEVAAQIQASHYLYARRLKEIARQLDQIRGLNAAKLIPPPIL